MKLGLVFPGQGSQAVGMGRDLAEAYPAARAVFDDVNEALGEDLTRVMWDSDPETLTLTRNAQPALMAVSLAALRALESESGFNIGKSVACLAGHSLGEYSALAAAGSLSVSDTARLLRKRGEAMQNAVPVGEGAMAAIIGLDLAAVHNVVLEAAAGEICAAANDNAPGQIVVSGTKTAVERAAEVAKAAGAKRAMLLPVSAPFHCALMAPAADVMAAALAEVEIRPALVPVIANVTATPVSAPEDIRARLVEQVTGSVRWRESVEYMAGAGVTRMAELGAGKVLSGLIRRINRSVSTISFGASADMVQAVAFLADGGE